MFRGALRLDEEEAKYTICPHCGMNIRTLQELEECPFCGKELRDDRDRKKRNH